jgi:hypothetical protein
MSKTWIRFISQYIVVVVTLFVTVGGLRAEQPNGNVSPETSQSNHVFLPLVTNMNSQNAEATNVEQITNYIMAHPELQSSIPIYLDDGDTVTMTIGFLPTEDAAQLGFTIPTEVEVSAASAGSITYNCPKGIGAWTSWTVVSSNAFALTYNTRYGKVFRMAYAPSAGFFTTGYVPSSNSWVVSLDWTSTNYALRYLKWCQ